MNKNTIECLQNALEELDKDNELLLKKKDYFQVKNNAYTMSKIAEALNDYVATHYE